MTIRQCTPADLPTIVDITLEVFGPFYERTFRSMVAPEVFEHQHGAWADDYRRLVPSLLDVDHGKYVAVADDGADVHGYIAWRTDLDLRHGEIEILCVRKELRDIGIGRTLCEHAIAAMRDDGIEVVQVDTGGDDFHAPARHLYESLGFSHIPVAVYLRGIG